MTKNMLKLRRNHIAEAVGTHMYIHGGVDENENILNCSFVYSFTTNKWSEVVIMEAGDSKTQYYLSPYLSYHNSCLVLPSDVRNSSKLNLYRIPEMNKHLFESRKEVSLL